MKAVRIYEYGGPEQLRYEDVAEPQYGEDEVLVKVRATSINPIDWKIRDGLVRKRFNPQLPVIPGGDLSGGVAAVGPGVTSFRVGDPVFAMIGLLGAYAEHVTFKAAMAASKPASIDHVQAASVPLVGLTAWQALHEQADMRPGQRVFVLAAAGGYYYWHRTAAAAGSKPGAGGAHHAAEHHRTFGELVRNQSLELQLRRDRS